MLLQIVLITGLVLGGLTLMVHPPTGQTILKGAAKIAVGILAAQFLLFYLWTNPLGRILLLIAVAAGIVKIVRGASRNSDP